MKKLLSIILFLGIFISTLFAQSTPKQEDACKGLARGQNTYSVSIPCPNFPTSPYSMGKISVTYTITNTGASTLKVNNQTAVAITLNGSALSAGDIPANTPLIMMYDSISSKWSLSKPAPSSGVSTVTVTAGSNISVTSATNSFTVTNTAPNQTVTISGAGSTTVSGTYPTYTVTGASIALTNSVTPISSGTAGSVLVHGASDKLMEFNSQLFWDQNNSRLGIGTASPASSLHVNGVTRFGLASTTNASLIFQNSTNANTLTINSGITSASHSWTLPTTQGSAGTSLMNDGSGILSWGLPMAGSIVVGTTTIASGTSKAIPFNDGGFYGEDATVFVWDKTNNRLGIGISSPSSTLNIIGEGATSATYDLKIHNSSGTSNSLMVLDDGTIGMGTASPATKLELKSANPKITFNSTSNGFFGFDFSHDGGAAPASIYYGGGDLFALPTTNSKFSISDDAGSTPTTVGSSAFFFNPDGKFFKMAIPAADAGHTLIDGSYHGFESKYWTGAASVTTSFHLYNDAINTSGDVKFKIDKLVNYASDITLLSLDQNGSLAINSTQTSVNNSVSGTTKFAQPQSGTPFKIVIISFSAAVGTASYTFPVAFTTTPSVFVSNDVAAGIITSLSTTAVTATGTTTTGNIMLAGY